MEALVGEPVWKVKHQSGNTSLGDGIWSYTSLLTAYNNKHKKQRETITRS